MPLSTTLVNVQPMAATHPVSATSNVADLGHESSVRLEQIAQAKSPQSQLDALAFSGSAARFGNAGSASDSAILSPTARQIGQWLQAAQRSAQPLEVRAGAPLLAAADATATDLPARLAPRLQQALEGSGLFYEAHLRQWSEGERSLAQIRQEPQNQPTRTEAGPSSAPQSSPAASQVIHQTPTQAGQWVPLQLDALEQNRFAWQGEFWPGQPMQWEVRREHERAHQNATPADETAPAWQTVLKLHLPGLGQVKAQIRLQGGHAQLQLRAEHAETAERLQTERERLIESLAAAGTALDAFLVKTGTEA